MRLQCHCKENAIETKREREEMSVEGDESMMERKRGVISGVPKVPSPVLNRVSLRVLHLLVSISLAM